MLSDLAIGADHQSDFEKHCASLATGNPLGKAELQVNVLTTGHWPTFNAFSNLLLPPEMQKFVQVRQCIGNDHLVYDVCHGVNVELCYC
jgi:hypothetical protein